MPLLDGMIRYYAPERPTGRVLLDARQQRNGTLNGDYYAGDLHGWTWNFTSDAIGTTYGTLGALPDFAGDFTIAFWMRTNTTQTDSIPLASANVFGTGKAGVLFAARESGALYSLFRVAIGNTNYNARVAYALSSGQWYLWVGRRQGDTVSLLQPTVGSASVSGATGTVTHQASPRIGSGLDYLGCKGWYGPVAVWERAITDGEAWQWYRSGIWAIGRQLTGRNRRRVYGFLPATGARRRRILCGDYS